MMFHLVLLVLTVPSIVFADERLLSSDFEDFQINGLERPGDWNKEILAQSPEFVRKVRDSNGNIRDLHIWDTSMGYIVMGDIVISQEAVDALDAQMDEGLSLLEAQARIPRIDHVLLGLPRPAGVSMWPCPIPYAIQEGQPNQDWIAGAIADVEEFTRWRFVPRTDETDYIEFANSDGGCSSGVGKNGGRQAINLGSTCSRGTIVHEILHAVGVFHEQSRPDRDEYILVNLNNLGESDKEHNFDLVQGQTALGNYDFNSIMHYNAFSFSIDNCSPTIEIKSKYTCNKIGQRQSMTQGDVDAAMYRFTGSDVCGFDTSSPPLPDEFCPQNSIRLCGSPLFSNANQNFAPDGESNGKTLWRSEQYDLEWTPENNRWELLFRGVVLYAYADGASSDAASPIDVERWLFRQPVECPGRPRDAFLESDVFVVPCEAIVDGAVVTSGSTTTAATTATTQTMTTIPATDGRTPSPTLEPSEILRLTQAIVDDSGARILCDFNVPVSIPDVLTCESVVVNTTMVLLGDDAQCYFTSMTHMVIVLGANASISPGARDQVVFENLTSKAHPSVAVPRFGATLDPPVTPPLVEVSIVGPKLVSDCADLVLNGFGTSGSAGRPFTYSWILLTGGTNSLDQTFSSATGASIFVPRDYLQSSSMMSIQLNALNWLKASGSAFISVTVSSESVPLISGPTRVTVRREDPVTYKVLTTSSCANQTIVSYRWSSLTSGFNLTTLQENGYEYLRIPSNTLQAGTTYSFQVQVTTNQDTTASHSFSIVVKTPEAYAVAPTQRAICVDEACDSLELTGEEFFTIPDMTLRDSALFSWSCRFEGNPPLNSSEDGAQSGVPCVNETTQLEVFGSRDDPRDTVTLSTEQLRRLGPGVMVFEVHMHATDEYEATYAFGDGYTASLNVTLLPIAGVGVDTPSVIVAPVSVRKVDVGEKVSLEALVTYAGDPVNLQYEWRCVSRNFDLTNQAMLRSGVNSSFLVFAPNALLPGGSYTFEVIVSLAEGPSASATASVSFVTNFPPVGGSCSVVTPGEALTTPFSVACSAWADDAEDLPLQYRFTLYGGDTDRLAILSQWTESPATQAILAPGNYTILAQIRDNIGATTYARIRVDVSASQNQSATEFIAANVSKALESATPEESLQLIAAANAVLNEDARSDAPSLSTEAVQEVLFDALRNITQQQRGAHTSDELEQLLLGVSTFSDASSLQQEMGEYVDEIVDEALNGEFAEDGVTEGIAAAALTALGRVGAATEGVTSTSSASEFYDTFKNVIFQVSRGLVQDSIVGEGGTVVETDEMKFYARSSRLDDIDSRIELDGVTLDVPPSALSGAGDQDISNVVTSVVRFSYGSIFPTNGPGSPEQAQRTPPTPNAQRRGASLLASVVSTVSSGFGLLNTDISSAESGNANHPMFQQYRAEATSLFSVSGTVQVTYYDASSGTIDTANKQELIVSDLPPCEAITLNISHYDDSDVPRVLVRPSGAPPVCRHWDETSEQLEADCVTIDYSQDWTVCNCTHSSVLDVGGWGDFVPSASFLAAEESRAVTNENVALHPSGVAAITVVSFLFIGLVVYAVLHDRRTEYGPPSDKESARVVDIWKSRLRDDHKWLSIFLRRTRSRFPSHERAVVLFVYVLTTIAFASAFHGRRESGPDVMSALVPDWFSVALLGGALALLPSLFLSQMFKNTRSKSQDNASPNIAAEGDSYGDSRCAPVRRFFDIWSTGIVRGDEGILNVPRMFPAWVNIVNYVFAVLWVAMCITLILVFNLRFNLEDEQALFFFAECGRSSSTYNDMSDVTAWGLSFFLANVIDFLVTQPLLLLAFAIYASFKPSKQEAGGVARTSNALENGNAKQTGGAPPPAQPPVAPTSAPSSSVPPPVPPHIVAAASSSRVSAGARSPPSKPPGFQRPGSSFRSAPSPPAAPRSSGASSPASKADDSSFQSRARNMMLNIRSVRDDSPLQGSRKPLPSPSVSQQSVAPRSSPSSPRGMPAPPALGSRVSSVSSTPRSSPVPPTPRNARMPVPGQPTRTPIAAARPTRTPSVPPRPTRAPLSPANMRPPPVPKRW